MPIFTNHIIRLALPLALAVGFAGCEKKAVRVYTVPKEIPFEPPAPAHPDHPGHTDGDESPQQKQVWRPAIDFKLPDGWKDLGPDAANIARFAAGDVSVSVTALTSMEGNEAGLVNMWRQVRGEDPLPDEEAAKTLTAVEVAGAQGKMFEFADTSGGGASKRFVVAFTHRPEGSLFFKIQGSDEAVTAQRAAFFAFLKSAKLGAGSAPAPEEEPEPTPQIKLPAGWQQVKPGAMQVAKFTVPEVDGAKAEVAVSIFPSDTGGTASNVKRWRGQLGLPEGDDAAALADAKPLEGAPEGSVLVELVNEGQALTGAIVPRAGQWIFFKLTGGASAVAAARESFMSFVKGQP